MKGLQSDLQNLGENEHEKQESSYQHTTYTENKCENMDIVGQESILDSLEELAAYFSDETLVTIDEKKTFIEYK